MIFYKSEFLITVISREEESGGAQCKSGGHCPPLDPVLRRGVLALLVPTAMHDTASEYVQNKIKSLLLSRHHSTCALVSEILESVLQTVQKLFTYRQYILTVQTYTDDNVQNTHTYTQYTQCTIRHTYSYQYTLYTVCTHSTLYTHSNMQRCNRLYISCICNVMDVHWMVSSGRLLY